MQIPVKKVNKILVVRPDAIGDMVLTLPCVRMIKKQYPEAQVSVLASPYNAQIIKNEEYIDEIIYDWFKTDRVKGTVDFIKYIFFIRRQKFDVVIHYYSETPQVWLTFFAGIKYQIGDKAKIGLWPVFRKYGVFLKTFDQTKHVVEYNFQLLKSLGIELNEYIKLEINPGQENKERGREILKEGGRRAGVPLVGIQVGVGFGNKTISPEKFAAFIEALRKEIDVDICLTGHSKKEHLARDIIKNKLKMPIIDLVGKTTLPELMGVLAQYDLYAGVDTGPFHLAAALGVPQLAIFPTRKVKPTRWAPWRNRHLIVRESRYCKFYCPHEGCRMTVCSDKIDVDGMVEKAKRILNGEGFVNSRNQLVYWFQNSMNIMILYDKKTEKKAKEYFSTLSKNNFYVDLALVNDKKIYNRLIEKDINIIHNISGKRKLYLLFLRLIVSLKLFNPPLIVYGQVVEKTKEKIVMKYKECFENMFFSVNKRVR
ncbi:MAG: glycosyltransferase family 9 protein [bacterium]|nr:glycosyltransferase family 9 protein [bacterium]